MAGLYFLSSSRLRVLILFEILSEIDKEQAVIAAAADIFGARTLA
jgi:hypothetical protein